MTEMQAAVDTQETNPSPPAGDVQPVPVHVVKNTAPSRPRRKHYRTHYETFVLTPGDPVAQILPQDEARVIAWVQALDHDVVIGGTRGMVAAAVNTAQTPNTPNLPNGTLIPSANGAPYPVQDNGVVYVGATDVAANVNSRVSVSACYAVEES